MLSELHAVISGKVQGVGYRDFVRESAESLRLYGWVKNKEDDTVELLAQGYPDRLRELAELLQEGSVLAKVTGVATEFRTPRVLYEDFSVKV